MAYAILKKDQSGMPVFFSPMTGRKFGQPLGGWVAESEKAIQFAREADAIEFIDCFMYGQKESLNVVRV